MSSTLQCESAIVLMVHSHSFVCVVDSSLNIFFLFLFHRFTKNFLFFYFFFLLIFEMVINGFPYALVYVHIYSLLVDGCSFICLFVCLFVVRFFFSSWSRYPYRDLWVWNFRFEMERTMRLNCKSWWKNRK